MKKKTLSNKEIRELNEEIKKYNFQFDKKEKVEIVDGDKYKVVKSDNETVFFYLNNEILPALRLVLNGNVSLRKITVDMGAVKFVVQGADIMRPGIVEIEEGILKGEIVEIVDVNNKKALALGRALFNFDEIKMMSSGKAVENLHFIGDEIWNS